MHVVEVVSLNLIDYTGLPTSPHHDEAHFVWPASSAKDNFCFRTGKEPTSGNYFLDLLHHSTTGQRNFASYGLGIGRFPMQDHGNARRHKSVFI